MNKINLNFKNDRIFWNNFQTKNKRESVKCKLSWYFKQVPITLYVFIALNKYKANIKKLLSYFFFKVLNILD